MKTYIILSVLDEKSENLQDVFSTSENTLLVDKNRFNICNKSDNYYYVGDFNNSFDNLEFSNIYVVGKDECTKEAYKREASESDKVTALRKAPSLFLVSTQKPILIETSDYGKLQLDIYMISD